MMPTHGSDLRARLQAARVLVVGDSMLDQYLFGDVERISPEAPVPVVRVRRQEERLGGAANVALNVKALGPSVTLITVVGDDEPARKLESLLRAQAVDSVLGRDPKLYTCVKLRVSRSAASRRSRRSLSARSCSSPSDCQAPITWASSERLGVTTVAPA